MRSLLLLAAATALLIVLTGWIWLGLYVNAPAPGSGMATVFIPKGAGLRRIKTILGREGVIKDDLRFLILARLTDSGHRLRAGEFAIARNLHPVEVLKILEQGEVVQHPLTIPEGLTTRQTAAVYAQSGWVDQQQFLALCKDPAFIHGLGIQQEQLEGYLFPDTYLLVRGKTDSRTIITTMVNRFLAVWREVSAGQSTTMSRHEIVTLASIIEKETADPKERPLIAGVFLNRLEKSMRLQSDPTVIYGLNDFSGNLTRKDLKQETPYNTYVIKGLPPGPICNPGRAALEAVFHPEQSDALYFVSKNDGTHVFSKSLNEHNRAVRKYQK